MNNVSTSQDRLKEGGMDPPALFGNDSNHRHGGLQHDRGGRHRAETGEEFFEASQACSSASATGVFGYPDLGVVNLIGVNLRSTQYDNNYSM